MDGRRGGRISQVSPVRGSVGGLPQAPPEPQRRGGSGALVIDHERQAVQALLDAYRRGLFPMAQGPGRPLAWFNPDPRGVIPLREQEGLHIPRRLRDRVRSGRFTMTTDRAFEAVMRGCALPRPSEPQTWIDDRIVAAYTALHRAGHAHSVEAWLDDEEARRPADERRGAGHPLAPWLAPGPGVLVGGLYGVHIGAVFFAESKFCLPPLGGTDASKVCLVHLILHLRRRGFGLLDVQFWNPHIAQFGCREIPRARYLAQLAAGVAKPTAWLPFEPECDRAAI